MYSVKSAPGQSVLKNVPQAQHPHGAEIETGISGKLPG